jgi:hypothetical protein
MEKVTLSKAARKAFGEKLGKPVPDPNSEEFDELLEELREMQPDAYNDLYSALEYKSEPLPVEKEALRAHKRAQRQRLANHIKNRETHDGKQITDKRKTIVVGGALATILMGWIGYTNVSRGFMAQAASVADEPAAQASVADVDDSPFGVRADTPELGEELDIPEAVQVVQTVPPPPPKESPEPTEQPRPEPARTESSLPFGMGRPLETSQDQDEPEDKLPPVPGPPQTGVASAPPTSPYLPAQSGTATGGAAEPTVLPGNLSFVPPEATPEGPLNVLSSEGGQDTGLPGEPGSTLAASSAMQSEPSQALPPPTSLGGVSSEEETPAASTLGWEDAESQEGSVEEKSLSFAQQDRLSESAAVSPAMSKQPLPPVPQVGGGVPPAPATPKPAQGEAVSEPEVTDLSALLTPGTQLQAELVTGVAAADGVAMPVIARTTGDWCGESTCSEITWIGEANYPGTDRVELTFTQAVVANTAQSVAARAFGGDQLPGVRAGVRDVAPTAVQDLLRGAVGGASDYLDAFNSRETVIISEGEIIRQQAEPDLGTFLLGRGTELFSLPSDQTSIVRLAEIAPGTPFTVIYGL